MFDEYFNPPTIDVFTVPVIVAPRAVDSADSPVSMLIDQDAPSTSILSTQDQEHSLIFSQSFEESPKTPHFHDDPLHESLHVDSTSQGSSSNVRQIYTPFESLSRWTKYHPIANVIGDPSRSVSTRKQLQTDAMWCYFDSFLTSVKPKNFKQAMNELSWIDAMQEEIHEFKRLQVWELVPFLVIVAPRAVDSADSSVSMSIDQDAPSANSISQGSSSNVRPIHTLFESLSRWTKDHPIANVIGDPSRSISTRKQLQTDAMWCYFDAFLTSVEPKNFKQAMNEPSWIDAMQEEILEFKRLQVWELVPCLDIVMLIKLKWIYKVKTDEYGGVLKNKSRLVAQRFMQEEGIDFEESFAPVARIGHSYIYSKFSQQDYDDFPNGRQNGILKWRA
nr:hypothetical protein [Tanacetum cinerariifolium]